MDRLISYFKKPSYCLNKKPKGIYFLFLFLFYIIATVSIGIISFIICEIFEIKQNEIKLTPIMTILIGVILAPFYEEIIFRSLLKFKKSNIILFIVTLTILITISILNTKINLGIVLIIILFSFITLLIIFPRNKIELFISLKFKYFFYLTTISFGLVHILNFTGNVYLILVFSFILTGPQLVLGLILGFIRMNYGLIYSISFHILVNTSLLLTLFH